MKKLILFCIVFATFSSLMARESGTLSCSNIFGAKIVNKPISPGSNFYPDSDYSSVDYKLEKHMVYEKREQDYKDFLFRFLSGPRALLPHKFIGNRREIIVAVPARGSGKTRLEVYDSSKVSHVKGYLRSYSLSGDFVAWDFWTHKDFSNHFVIATTNQIAIMGAKLTPIKVFNFTSISGFPPLSILRSLKVNDKFDTITLAFDNVVYTLSMNTGNVIAKVFIQSENPQLASTRNEKVLMTFNSFHSDTFFTVYDSISGVQRDQFMIEGSYEYVAAGKLLRKIALVDVDGSVYIYDTRDKSLSPLNYVVDVSSPLKKIKYIRFLDSQNGKRKDDAIMIVNELGQTDVFKI